MKVIFIIAIHIKRVVFAILRAFDCRFIYNNKHRRMNKALPSYIYFICETMSGSPLRQSIKIGESFYPQQRLVQLQTGNYRPLYFHKIIACPNKDSAKKIEAFLHAFYSEYRLYGEWFKLSIHEINKVSETIEILIRDQLPLDIFHDIYMTIH